MTESYIGLDGVGAACGPKNNSATTDAWTHTDSRNDLGLSWLAGFHAVAKIMDLISL
jgi:hypothetical protein